MGGRRVLAVKDTYARKSLRYNFSPTLADHPGIFHAKLPPAGASQLVVLTPPLTRDPPLFLSPIRRVIKLPRTCHARGSKLHGAEATRRRYSELRKECVHPARGREFAVYLGGGRGQQMVGRSRSSRRRAVIVIRWHIVALSRFVWHPMDDRFRVTSIYSARLADLWQDEDGT